MSMARADCHLNTTAYWYTGQKIAKAGPGYIRVCCVFCIVRHAGTLRSAQVPASPTRENGQHEKHYSYKTRRSVFGPMEG